MLYNATINLKQNTLFKYDKEYNTLIKNTPVPSTICIYPEEYKELLILLQTLIQEKEINED